MKLLVITQIVDETDSNLGFFHNWLKKIASNVDHLYIICLKEGAHSLPSNVTVLSLGKEKGVSRFEYLWRFYKYIWRYRRNYDNVLVHMNPEYVVLAGWLWRMWNKKVLLWYMHKSVDLKLRIAEKFVNKIFTASKESFRLPSKKVQVVGHGIDLTEFTLQTKPQSKIISLFNVSRITRSKDLITLIKGVAELKKIINVPVFLEVAGATITHDDELYFIELKKLIAELALENSVKFLGGLGRVELAEAFGRSLIFVHSSQTGSMDKVVLEALASGRLVISSSEAYSDLGSEGVLLTFTQGDSIGLAQTIEKVYKSGIVEPDKLPNQPAIDYVKKNHNLDNLIAKIIEYFTV